MKTKNIQIRARGTLQETAYNHAEEKEAFPTSKCPGSE